MRRTLGPGGTAVALAAALSVMGSANAQYQSSGTLAINTIGSIGGLQPPVELFNTANLHLGTGQSHDLSIDVETNYLPHVLEAQEQEAGTALNPEALKAIAVADRSLLYSSLVAKGWIGSGGSAPKYKKTILPEQPVFDAVAETSTEYLQSDQIIAGLSIGGTRPSNLTQAKHSITPGIVNIQTADFLADHGWNYLDILHLSYGQPTQLTVGSNFAPYDPLLGGSTVTFISTPPTTEVPGPRLILSGFDHDAGFLQSAAQKNRFSQYVTYDSQTTATRSTVAPHSGTASELININYDKAHAKGLPFVDHILTGVAGEEGEPQGNVRLFGGTMGFFCKTKTPGLTARIQTQDGDFADTTSTQSLKADGHWHEYDFTSPGGDGPFTLKSVNIAGTSDASLRIDDLFYRPSIEQQVSSTSGGEITGLGAAGTLTLANSGAFSGLSINQFPASRFTGIAQSPNVIATVLAPEPLSTALIAIAALALARRRGRNHPLASS